MRITKIIRYLIVLFILSFVLIGCSIQDSETMGEVSNASENTIEMIVEPSTKPSEQPDLDVEISKSQNSLDTLETPLANHVANDTSKKSDAHLESSNIPSSGTTEKTSPTSKSTETSTPQSTPYLVTEPESVQQIDTDKGKDEYLTDPVPEGKPLPMEPQNIKVTEEVMTCTLSVSCTTILDNMKNLDKEKIELVPEDGVIFKETEVTFYQGESVFDILQREMKKNQIHMEFVNTPIYNSAYIEGINNLYEFDCGELSGWMYKVNGWFPNYGCSRYQLKAGDVIDWVYTCDLGRDVGDQYYSVGGE